MDICNPSLEVWKKVLDALPNLKKVKVVTLDNIENLALIVKNISIFKHLKFIDVGICSRDDD